MRGIINKTIFWTLDYLKGSPIRSELKKVKSDLELPDSNQNNNKRLRQLIKHATSTTKFYGNFTSEQTLDSFPLIDKNIIRDNLDKFISSNFTVKDCKKVSTSGSTGTPFSIYQNKKKIQKNIADNIYYSAKSGYDIGDQLVYIKIWSDKLSNKQLLNLKMKNISPISVYKLTDNDIDALVNKLNNTNKSISLIGYASAFEKICKYLDTKPQSHINFLVHSVITISEALNTYTQQAIKKHFGISPLSRYSNNENGIIAQQLPNDNLKFKVNTSSYNVEIFDLNEDKKLPYGQRGRIVITDLYNYATPLIRYDTGDVGTLQLGEDKQLYLSKIFGRKLDLLYDTKGNLIPEHLSAKLCNYGEFKQFQLIQKHRRDYLINLNTDKRVDEEKMISEYKGYFGEDANVKINYVDEIPLLRSGKRREVVNEFYSKIKSKTKTNV